MTDFKPNVQDMQLEVSTPTKVFSEMNLKLLKKNNPSDLTRYFFNDPYGHDDGVIRSLLCDATDFFKQSGLPSESLRAGLLIYTALNSVGLGYPIPIILRTNELIKARHLLDLCKKIAPREAFREVQQLKYEQLYSCETKNLLKNIKEKNYA